MSAQILYESGLVKLWRVGENTPRLDWRLPFFVQEEDGSSSVTRWYCYHREVNRYHRRVGRGFTAELQMPTVADLLADGPGSLLTTNETAVMLGVSASAIQHRALAGTIPVFALGKETYRYPARLIAYLATPGADRAVSLKEAAAVLCVTEGTARILMNEGKLQRTIVINEPTRWVQVTRSSVIALMINDRLLPDYVSPTQWWQDSIRHHYQGNMLSASRAARRAHIDSMGLEALLLERRDPFIKTPAGRRLLVPEHVIAQLEADRIGLSAREVARAFGVDTSVAQQWIDDGRLCNRVHGGKKKRLCPSRECLAAYVLEHRTHDTVDPAEWLTTTLVNGVGPMLSSAFIAFTPGADNYDVAEALEAEELHGVRLPTIGGRPQEIALARAETFPLARAIRQRERRMRGEMF